MPLDALGTTNTVLWIVAVTSVVELAALVALSIFTVRLYRNARATAHVALTEMATLGARVHRLADDLESALADVKIVTAAAATGARRAERALEAFSGVAGFALSSARGPLALRMSRAVAIAGGIRLAYRMFSSWRPFTQHASRDGHGAPHTEVVHGT